jgi:hypothetical protein
MQKAKLKKLIWWGKPHSTFTEVVAETSELKRASSNEEFSIKKSR